MRNRRIMISALFLIIVITGFCTTGIMSQAKDEHSTMSYKYYTSITIMPGETVDSIAVDHYDTHFTSIDELKNEIMIVNSLEDGDKIYAGNSLIIPYFSEEFR